MRYSFVGRCGSWCFSSSGCCCCCCCCCCCMLCKYGNIPIHTHRWRPIDHCTQHHQVLITNQTNLLPTRMVRLSSIIFSSFILGASSRQTSSPWGVVSSIPRGGDASYTNVCEEVKCGIIEAASKEVRSVVQ